MRGPPKLVRKVAPPQVANEEEGTTDAKPPSSAKKQKKKPLKKLRSRGSEENKILWEEQQTQIQNISWFYKILRCLLNFDVFVSSESLETYLLK